MYTVYFVVSNLYWEFVIVYVGHFNTCYGQNRNTLGIYSQDLTKMELYGYKRFTKLHRTDDDTVIFTETNRSSYVYLYRDVSWSH